MKRIKLTYGTAMVDDDVSEEVIDALNKLSECAYNIPKENPDKSVGIVAIDSPEKGRLAISMAKFISEYNSPVIFIADEVEKRMDEIKISARPKLEVLPVLRNVLTGEVYSKRSQRRKDQRKKRY